MFEAKHLKVTAHGNQVLLHDVSFSLKPGQCLGLTGASGSGKTTLLKTIMGVLPPGCRLSSGTLLLDGTELQKLTVNKRRNYCGTVLGFIPQNPMTAFDPADRIGVQMCETFHLRLGKDMKSARQIADQLLREVNLEDTARILDAYPQQLSGGMLQRVAMALLAGLSPQYILADEPTSALDEENRNHLLHLLKTRYRSAGILFISHDVEALHTLCPETMVMDHGTIVERQPTEQLFLKPIQPWTQAFAEAVRQRKGGTGYGRLCDRSGVQNILRCP